MARKGSRCSARLRIVGCPYANTIKKLSLFSDKAHESFTLEVEGSAAPSRTFRSLPAAILGACQAVEEETPLTLYDETGQPRLITTVYPEGVDWKRS